MPKKTEQNLFVRIGKYEADRRNKGRLIIALEVLYCRSDSRAASLRQLIAACYNRSQTLRRT